MNQIKNRDLDSEAGFPAKAENMNLTDLSQVPEKSFLYWEPENVLLIQNSGK